MKYILSDVSAEQGGDKFCTAYVKKLVDDLQDIIFKNPS